MPSEPYKLIPLTQNQSAIVDADDYEQLKNFRWFTLKQNNTCYAARTDPTTRKKILMHRQILNAPPHLLCDHINHNGLDNRKSNLRLCTAHQNCFNRKPAPGKSSKYKGVSRRHRALPSTARPWRAAIWFNYHFIHIGCFQTQAEAALAYDAYAKNLFGQFAFLNSTHFPELPKTPHQPPKFKKLTAKLQTIFRTSKNHRSVYLLADRRQAGQQGLAVHPISKVSYL